MAFYNATIHRCLLASIYCFDDGNAYAWITTALVAGLWVCSSQQAQAARDLDGVTTLGIDEIAGGRGQTYGHSGPLGGWVM